MRSPVTLAAAAARVARGRAGTSWMLAVPLVLGLLVTGCTGPGSSAEGTQRRGDGLSGRLVVFAASSLTESFQRLGREFEARHPGVEVTFSFDGSSTLAPQITAGAPADVFAAADRRTMARVVAAGATAARPALFARNRLQIAVPPGNPGNVDGLDDFARENLTLSVCAPAVPCGAAAQRAFAAAGVKARPDTFEQEVKAVLTKVELGEVDAGLVYRTDVLTADDRVQGMDFPDSEHAVNDYMIAPLAEAPNPAAARAFVGLVRSPAGREALADGGFDLP
jgi:molybdate transport system substrate-binding protein